MKTKYGIPQTELDEIVTRDIDCVYCHKSMLLPFVASKQGDSATIEHLNHRADQDTIEVSIEKGIPVESLIAICCGACNSSRGNLPLLSWFKTKYCNERNINIGTVSKVVRNYIRDYESTSEKI